MTYFVHSGRCFDLVPCTDRCVAVHVDGSQLGLVVKGEDGYTVQVDGQKSWRGPFVSVRRAMDCLTLAAGVR